MSSTETTWESTSKSTPHETTEETTEEPIDVVSAFSPLKTTEEESKDNMLDYQKPSTSATDLFKANSDHLQENGDRQYFKEAKEHLFKVLVIGELSTGKTSFIKRYVHQFFSQHYRATIGVDFALKVIDWDDRTLIRLQLWDIAGVYYKEAVGAFLVFDVNRSSTFDALLKWKHDLDTKVCLPDGSPIPCLLLANKCDMPKEGAAKDADILDKFCEEHGFCGWYYTSAKDNVNVEESAKYLVAKILQRQKTCALEESANNDILTLDYSSHGDSTRRKCNC